MRSLPRALIILLPLLLVSVPGHTEELTTPTTSASSGTTPYTPARGMTMQQVEANSGAPRNRLPAIGNPPVSRWQYEGFTVYFEHQHVIHTVIHR